MIYMATNSVNFKNYIGQTAKTLAQRRWRHERNARVGKRSRFYSAMRKYGTDVFGWRVLISDSGDRKTTDDYERFFIRLFSTQDPECGYNLTSGGEGMSNPSDETRQRMSESHKGQRTSVGRKHSAAALAKMSASHRGKHPSVEHRAKISAALAGRPGRITFLGKKHSEETRAKMSASAYARYRGEHAS
jgi:group I intron endonuclease